MGRIPVWRRYARLFGPDPAADVDDELRFHLDAKTDDLVRQGWNPDAARIETERQFGDLGAVRRTGGRLGGRKVQSERHRDYWGAWARDFRYALRTLRRDRGFAIVTALILALGIAANTAVFSVVNTVLLRPLPFPDAQQLTSLTSGRASLAAGRNPGGLSGSSYTVAAYEEFQRSNRSFQQVGGYNPFLGSSEFTLTGHGEAQVLAGLMVTENFFQTLGVQPLLGRAFSREEHRSRSGPAVVLSHALWQRQFGGDPAIVGQAIALNRESATVAGVLPRTFDFGSVFSPGTSIDIYVPAPMDQMRTWGNTLALVGRLKPGVSVAQAQAEADVLFPQLQAGHREWVGDYTSTVTGLKESVSGKLRRALVVLWCAAGLVLLIACVNLSNLVLARAATRSREFALRSALGAGRGRLLRQLLTESMVLSGAGALLGIVLAFATTTYLARQSSIAVPLLSSVTIDGAALLWTLLIAITVGVLLGLAPGLNISTNLQGALKDGGRGSSTGKKHEHLRAAIVVSEVALACVLLVGAGLLLRSFLRVLDVDLGFQPSRAAVIKVAYDDRGSRERRSAILREMVRNIESIPGIEVAGVADMLPLGRNRSWTLAAKGQVYPNEMDYSVLVRIVTPGYLKAMGMRLKKGRDFTWQDTPESEPVMIINDAAARRFWPGEEALGRVANDSTEGRDTRVTGVISDVRAHSLETAAGPEMYLPATQNDPRGAELVVRAALPPDSLASSVMKKLRSLNPAQPAAELRPLQHIVDRSVSPRRFFVWLVGSFAALGLILASLGIYGVISFSVAGQTQQIGVRMALGATPSKVRMEVIARALKLTFLGVAAGSVGSLAAAKGIESLLFGARPTDATTFAATILLLGAMALSAGYIPARRASRIDPIVALRAD